LLPEPLVDDEASRDAETADSLSLTFLHLLEKLSPVERAVFLLREVFDYSYDEVARIVESTASRAWSSTIRTDARAGSPRSRSPRGSSSRSRSDRSSIRRSSRTSKDCSTETGARRPRIA
jgi:RNA polymerase sigma-70 factor (ECF subfamily)